MTMSSILMLVLLTSALKADENANPLPKNDDYENSLMEYATSEDESHSSREQDGQDVLEEAIMTPDERTEIFQSFIGKNSARYSYVILKEFNHQLRDRCNDEDTFSTHEECVHKCLNVSTEVKISPKITPTIEDALPPKNLSTLVMYKLLILYGYQLNDSDNEQFPSKVFILDKPQINDSVFLCYPLSLTFDLCQKTFLNPTEVGILSDRKLWSYKAHRSYDADEYFINKKDKKIVVCSVQEKPDILNLGFFRWIGLLISAVTLFVTLMESFNSASKIHKKHYILIRYHVLVLFTGYVVFLLKHYLRRFTTRLCIILSMIQQYSFLSAFFWINAQVIEIYIIKGEGYKEFNNKYPNRYVYYILYSVLVPAVICVTTYVAEFFEIPGMNATFGKNCWFITDSYEVLFFYYGWMGTILVINVIVLILTLKRVGPTTNVLYTTIDVKNFQRLLNLTTRLEVTLAICWIIKFTTWINGKKNLFLYHLDTITYFQGFFIFLVCYLKFTSITPKTADIIPKTVSQIN